MRLKWLTDVRYSGWYLALFNLTRHGNKGGRKKIEDTRPVIGRRGVLQRYRLVVGPMESRLGCTHASSSTWCSCVCAGRVLEVTCCVFITAAPELPCKRGQPFYMATVVFRVQKKRTTLTETAKQDGTLL